MEKLLAKAGLFMTTRNLNILQDLLLRNLTRLVDAVSTSTGLIIAYGTDGQLADDWEIEDMGSGNIRVKAGIAILPDHEIIELEADSDSMAVTDDSSDYSVIIKLSTDSDYIEKEKGTVAVATSSLTLTGTGTLFLEEFEVGERIALDATNAANQVPLIIDSITSNTELAVSATDGNGGAVALTTETGIDFWSIGRFAAGYPAGADTENIRNHNKVAISITASPAGDYITLGTVNRTGASVTITDSREASLLELFSSSRHSRTSDKNLSSDSVKANRFGGNTIWWEGVTNGTTEVIMDTTIDWRDRWITMQGWISTASATPASLRPGTGSNIWSAVSVNDSGAIETSESKKHVAGMLFTGAAEDYLTLKNGGDVIRIFADSSTGALTLVKGANASNQHAISLKIDYSPRQNH